MTAARISTLEVLAPAFRSAVEAALVECAARGLDAVVYETLRTRARQEALYAQGRTTPGEVVTNAQSALYSWHGFALAVDVVSRAHDWDAPAAWWDAVGESFERHGCSWGGRWQMHDLPHMQWARCRVSPSARARELYIAGGLPAVWREVGAAPAAGPVVVTAPPVPAVEPDVVDPPAHLELWLPELTSVPFLYPET